jgi:hypothetical protein
MEQSTVGIFEYLTFMLGTMWRARGGVKKGKRKWGWSFFSVAINYSGDELQGLENNTTLCRLNTLVL